MFVSFDPFKSCVSMCYHWQHNCAFSRLVSNLLMNIFSENQISYMSVSNIFITNHIVRFLTITNVERLKSLKSSFFFFFLIFTFMQLIFWINIVSQVFSSSSSFFLFFEKNIVSYVDALSLLYYVGASRCQPCKHQCSHLERICSFNPREKHHVPNTTWS